MRLLIGFCLLAVALGRQGFGPTDQEWGYVTVREGAHMFWWLHYTTATTKPTEKPLIIYLQGGPGRSSTQYGYFEEIGPLDSDQKPRNYTWVNDANVLFVDNPVGVGFSYLNNNTLFAKSDKQVARDFVVLMQGFYKELPQFQDVPLYIFSESYGAKMAVHIAYKLYRANLKGTIKSNIKGVGLGAAWITPVESILTWAPYLYTLGMLDTQQYELSDKRAQDLKLSVDTGKYADAADKYVGLISWFQNLTSSTTATFLDVLALNGPNINFNFGLGDTYQHLMNDIVKPALNLSRNWTSPNRDVFNNLKVDFIKPVPNVVEKLLNKTDIIVDVYNGHLDVFVPTESAIKWVNNLHFKGSENWTTATREVFAVNGIYEGFQKRVGNFIFHWLLRTGHEAPRQNPNAMLHVLQQVTNNFKV